MTDANCAVETAHAGHKATQRRHRQERLALLVSELGADEARRDQFGMRTVNPHRNAHDARARATLARAEADELRSITINDAARRIEAKRAEQELTRVQAAQRAPQRDPFERDTPRTAPGRDGPAHTL